MKIISIALVLLLSCTLAFSQEDTINPGELLSKLPLKGGVAYSLCDHEFNPSASFEVIGKWGFSFDVGYVGSDELAIFTNYKLKVLDKWFDMPILKYVNPEVGAYYGFDRIIKGESGEDYGINLKFVTIKF